jgi:hypothetical protein
MSTSINIHRVDEVTVKQDVLSSGTYVTTITITSEDNNITEIDLFSKYPLKIEEN